MKPVWRKVLAALVGVSAVVMVWSRVARVSERTRTLPDGSVLTLQAGVFTNGPLGYVYEPGGAIGRRIAPFVPQFLRDRFDLGVSRPLKVEGPPGTNLCLIALNGSRTAGWETSLVGAEVFDDKGNVSDLYQSDSFRYPRIGVNGEVFRVFPRRSREIGLRFFSESTDGTWTNVAEFHVPNPFYAVYPQWTPEPWPVTHLHGDLGVTLEEFRTGVYASDQRGMGARRDDDAVALHNTMARFSFTEKGVRSENWRVENLTVSDATGNRLSSTGLGLSRMGEVWWSRPGTVELSGALWPGESAWRLQVELVRKNGIDSNDLWTIPIPVPPFLGESPLTNQWEHSKVGLRLRQVSRETSGPALGRICWLTADVERLAPGFCVFVATAVDQDGNAISVLNHSIQGSVRQFIPLVHRARSTAIFLTLAVHRSVVLEFTARPEFPP